MSIYHQKLQKENTNVHLMNFKIYKNTPSSQTSTQMPVQKSKLFSSKILKVTTSCLNKFRENGQ